MYIGITAAVILAVALVSLLYVGCAHDRSVAPDAVKNLPPGKVLTVVFSESKTKSTLTVAKWIQGYVGGDLEDIQPVTPFSVRTLYQCWRPSPIDSRTSIFSSMSSRFSTFALML